jgi:hypothetical protein
LQAAATDSVHAKQLFAQAALLSKKLKATEATISAKFVAKIETAAKTVVEEVANTELPPTPSPTVPSVTAATAAPTAATIPDWLKAPTQSAVGGASFAMMKESHAYTGGDHGSSSVEIHLHTKHAALRMTHVMAKQSDRRDLDVGAVVGAVVGDVVADGVRTAHRLDLDVDAAVDTVVGDVVADGVRAAH